MSGNVAICDVSDSVKAALKSFRFSKIQQTRALILKVNRENHQIVLDEELENTTVDDICNSLPSQQPRFVIISYRREHDDGRVSFPLCLVFHTPRDSHPELQVMYAGSKIALQKAADLNRGFEIRELDDFTEEWLLSKLGN